MHAVVARSTFRSQKKCKHLRGGCRFAWQTQGLLHLVKAAQKVPASAAVSTTTTKVHSTALQLQLRTTTTTLLYAPLRHLNYGTLNYNYKPNYNYHFDTLRYTTLTTLHCTKLHSASLRYTSGRCTTTTTTLL